MSNVLIGIIGVILFIGLALAGALFLGPRFQESANNSKASAAVAMAQQISAAMALRNLDKGTTPNTGMVPNDLYNGAAGEYLKVNPKNPVTGAWDIIFTDVNAMRGVFPYPYVAQVVLMRLGNNADTTAAAICAAVARQSGQPSTDADANGVIAIPVNPSGCFHVRPNNGFGDVVAGGEYYVYSRV